LQTKLQEILEELKTVVSGKTIDALFPPLIFVIVNALSGLNVAVYTALGFALLLGVSRIARKQNWLYASGGFLGVVLASGLAYLTRSAAGYFIPAIISSSLLVLAALLSLFTGKPIAAWASHLTRGWPLGWFWRKDIKPAYMEVTFLWAAFFTVRLAIQIYLFKAGEAAALAWVNTLLGWPVLIIVLVITYIYGIWRLGKLGGPGVEEYKAGKEPPWQGQKRGF